VDWPTGHAFMTALVTGLLLGGLFAVTALGLSLIFGVLRLINLVHGELLVLGAYFSFELGRRTGIDPLVGLIVIVPVVFLVAYPAERILLGPLIGKGAEAPLMTTFGLSIILVNVYILAFHADTRSLEASYATDSMQVRGIDIPVIYAISFGFAVVITAATHVFLQRTGYGREIRAASEDAGAAEVLGVNVARAYGITYALGAAFAAIGGVLVGLAFGFNPSTGTTWLLTGFAVVVLGGLGSLKGTLIGGLLLGVAESVGASFPQVGDGYRDFIGFMVFLVILAVRPRGLYGRTALTL
jgi:branched-chain amino acid transport system permease protein